MEEFLAQWMRFDRVLGATRDRRRFREFNAEVAAAMVEETRRLFNHLVWNDQNFMEFFTADYTFVNAGPRPALRPAGARRGIRARSSIRPIPAAPACWGTAASWC